MPVLDALMAVTAMMASHHSFGAKADAPSLENRRAVRIVGGQQLH